MDKPNQLPEKGRLKVKTWMWVIGVFVVLILLLIGVSSASSQDVSSVSVPTSPAPTATSTSVFGTGTVAANKAYIAALETTVFPSIQSADDAMQESKVYSDQEDYTDALASAKTAVADAAQAKKSFEALPAAPSVFTRVNQLFTDSVTNTATAASLMEQGDENQSPSTISRSVTYVDMSANDESQATALISEMNDEMSSQEQNQ